MIEPQPLPPRECFVLARALSSHAGHLRAALGPAQPRAPATSLVGRDEAALRALGLPASSARWLSAPDERVVEDDRAWALAQGIHLALFDDEAIYPPQLTPFIDAPVALWVRGDPAVLRSQQLAVVGSRHPDGGRRTPRPPFRPAAGARGAHGHERSGARHRRGRARRRARRRRPHRRRLRHRPRRVLPPPQRGARGAHRRGGRRDRERVPARHAAEAGPLPAPQPHHQRAVDAACWWSRRRAIRGRSSPRGWPASRAGRSWRCPDRSTARCRRVPLAGPARGRAGHLHRGGAGGAHRAQKIYRTNSICYGDENTRLSASAGWTSPRKCC